MCVRCTAVVLLATRTLLVGHGCNWQGRIRRERDRRGTDGRNSQDEYEYEGPSAFQRAHARLLGAGRATHLLKAKSWWLQFLALTISYKPWLDCRVVHGPQGPPYSSAPWTRQARGRPGRTDSRGGDLLWLGDARALTSWGTPKLKTEHDLCLCISAGISTFNLGYITTSVFSWKKPES